ncbi:MAG TPA: alanine--glyoxylate aminotransferase family protein [Bacillota bacterium]|nr:alanine--glyoxylate aminotransferase family protein [Bacillota bacterium]
MIESVKLMVPGPTQLPPEVIDEMAQPMIYHRGKEFVDITLNAIDLLKKLFNTKRCDVLLIPSSGRGAMEAALVNLFSHGDKLLSVSNGYFGEVFSKMAKAYGLDVASIKFNWEDVVDYSTIEESLKNDGNIKAILFTHCETSNAVENDLRAIGSLAKKYNKLLIVDAVSSFGCMPINVDEYGIDVAVTASQKGLMCPAGMSVAAISPKAWDAIENAKLPKYYFDFRNMRDYIQKGQTPVSTPVSIVRALNASLKLMNKEGFDRVFERHEKLAEYIREEAKKSGYVLYPDNQNVKRANSLSAFLLPPEIKAEILVSHIHSKYNTLFAKGLGDTASRILRIGHMGWFREEESIHALKVLKAAKNDFGF